MSGKAILLDEAALDVVRFASSDYECLPGMFGLHVTPERVEATNGHILMQLKHDDMPAADYPNVEGSPDDAPPDCILSADSVKAISKARAAAAKSTRTLPILARVKVSANGDGKPVLTVTDLESPTVMRPVPVEGRFPDASSVMVGAEGRIAVGFNAHYLKLLAEYAIRHGNKSVPTVAFYFEPEADKAASDACRVEVHLRDGRHAEGVLMPVRL